MGPWLSQALTASLLTVSARQDLARCYRVAVGAGHARENSLALGLLTGGKVRKSGGRLTVVREGENDLTWGSRTGTGA